VSPCSAPLPPDTVLGYWLGELTAPAEDAAETHLIGCTDCSRRVERHARLGETVRNLIRRGGVSLGLTPALLARLEQDGVRIRHHRVEAGGQTRCTAGPDDDLIAVTLRGEFRADERVDLAFLDAPSTLGERRTAVPVDLERGEVVFAESGDVIRALPANRATIRLYGTGAAGERTIGEYTLLHTPWPEGGSEMRHG
jgi:hypothetical protein